MNALQKVDGAELPEWGPRMLALPTERQRRFVAALFDEGAPAKGDGLMAWAAREAGYGTATSSTKSLGVIACRLVHDDRVRAAMAEFSQNVVRAIGPEAVRAVKNLIRNPRARDHMRAISTILDRGQSGRNHAHGPC